jgi:asparagine synthase (glutamine-hydrolysing)
MCGIAGMIELTGDRRPAPRGAVERMAAAIVHRGPDEDGFLDRPGLALANRRLSIVGLADGQQPISNEDGTVWTVFNGELFDYPETKAKLEAKGHVFRTHTDTELIPHLWEEYREKMLEHVRGQFAFCVWDSRTNEFLLARDRSGICPFFYTHQTIDGTDWMLFASEAKALFASGFVRARPDLTGINHIFTFFAMPGPATVYEGISILAPGRYLHFRPGRGSPETQLQQKTYWEVSYPDRGDEDYGANEEKTVKDFEEVLFGSVTRRLRADVPVVSYLSGGVDSSLVVAMASKAIGRPIPTFTVSVTGKKGLNEENEALQTARYLGCDPVVVPCGHEELRIGYPELIAAAEFPVMDTSCVGLMHLAQAVRKNGYKVALTGEGADEWLAGYSWFKINRLTRWLDAAPGVPGGYLLRKALAMASGNKMYPRSMIRHVQQTLGGQNGWMDVYGMMSLNKLRFFSPALKEKLIPQSPYDDLGLTPNLHRWHPFHRQMYLGARIMLPGHLLASKGDRVAMHSSVETRYPFLDEDVIAFMAKLHPRWKLRGLLKDKYIERKVAERWLPKDVAHRKKLMFRAPMDSWANVGAGATDRWIDEVLTPESIEKTGYFDYEAVTAARHKLARGGRSLGRTGLEMGLTAVVATQLWHHLYVSGDLASIESHVQRSHVPSPALAG